MKGAIDVTIFKRNEYACTMKNLFLVALAVLFVQCSNEDTFHKLDVISGTGTGVYEFGKMIRIEADQAGEDEAFFAWTGDTQFVDAINAPIATVQMPLQDVVVEATYKDLPRFELSITNGEGSGSYLAGTRVRITADPPEEDFLFDRWIGDTIYLERTDTSVSHINIPETNVVVEATYVEVIDLVSFSETVWPIFVVKCSYAGCHDADDPDTPLTNYNEIISSLGPVEESIVTGSMPKTGSLTVAEKDAILLWIEQGAPNN